MGVPILVMGCGGVGAAVARYMIFVGQSLTSGPHAAFQLFESFRVQAPHQTSARSKRPLQTAQDQPASYERNVTLCGDAHCGGAASAPRRR